MVVVGWEEGSGRRGTSGFIAREQWWNHRLQVGKRLCGIPYSAYVYVFCGSKFSRIAALKEFVE